MLWRKAIAGLGLLLIFVFAASIFMPADLNANTDKLDKQVKEKLEEIFNSDEFVNKDMENSFFESLYDKLKDIFEYIKEIFNKNVKPEQMPKGGIIAGDKGSLLDLILSVIMILGILAFVGFMLYKQFYKSKNIQGKSSDMLIKMADKPQEIKQEIDEAYKSGNYRQAFRYMYLGLLIDLNKINVIRIDKSKTNRQYLREVQKNGYRNYKAIEQFTKAFNDYWYGNKQLNKDDFEKWYSDYNKLLEGDVV